MSEQPKTEEAAPKKKGGKMIIIVVLVLLLGGGGFFMMKRGGGGPPKPPEAELGTIEPVAEFLVNLADGRTYLKAEIAVHLDKNFKKEELAGNMPAVKDAIVARLRSLTPDKLRSESGMRLVRRGLAADLNKVLQSLHKDEKAAPKAKEPGEKAGKGKEAKPDPKAKPKHPDWDSQEGPVLKVYFPSFATQSE